MYTCIFDVKSITVDVEREDHLKTLGSKVNIRLETSEGEKLVISAYMEQSHDINPQFIGELLHQTQRAE